MMSGIADSHNQMYVVHDGCTIKPLAEETNSPCLQGTSILHEKQVENIKQPLSASIWFPSKRVEASKK